MQTKPEQPIMIAAIAAGAAFLCLLFLPIVSFLGEISGLDLIRAFVSQNKLDSEDLLILILTIGMLAGSGNSCLMYVRGKPKAGRTNAFIALGCLAAGAVFVIAKLHSLEAVKALGSGAWLGALGLLIAAYQDRLSQWIPSLEQRLCPSCGKRIFGNSSFCEACGAAVEANTPRMRACPHCGKVVKELAQFCAHCGKAIVAQSTEYTAQAEILRRRIEASPLDAKLYVQLGLLHYRSQAYKEALIVAQEAIAIDSSFIDAQLLSANCFLQLDEAAKAEQYFISVLEADGDKPEAKVGLFRVLCIQNKVDEALKYSEDVRSLNPTDVELRQAIKSLLLTKGLKEEAVEELKAICNLDSQSEASWLELAKLYEESGKIEDALECYLKLLALCPGDLEFGLAAGRCAAVLQRHDDVIRLLRPIVDSLPDEVMRRGRTYLAYGYASKERIDEAIAELSQAGPLDAIPLLPDDRKFLTQVSLIVGRHLCRSANYLAATPYLQYVVDRDKDNAEAKKHLEDSLNHLQAASRRSRRKTLVVLLGIVIVCLGISVAWYFTHGKVVILTEPGARGSLRKGVGNDLGAEVPIDVSTGRYESSSLSSGTWQLQLAKEGFKEYRKPITVKRGATSTIAATLDSLTYTIVVNSQPRNASVLLDGADIGMTPMTKSGIHGKTHSIEITKAGYVPYQRALSFANGDSLMLGEISLSTVIATLVYKSVTIGNQVWMAENLKVTHYRNGDPIPNVTDGGTWGGLSTGAYCEYNNDVNTVATYGRLYNWYAVSDSRNIAPTGWHVPTDAEWQTLSDYLGGDAVAGGKLKVAGSTYWNSPNTGASNSSGFSALPGGHRSYLNNGSYNDLGIFAYFWSSTESDSETHWLRYLHYNYSDITRFNDSKGNGFSVRCVRDY